MNGKYERSSAPQKRRMQGANESWKERSERGRTGNHRGPEAGKTENRGRPEAGRTENRRRSDMTGAENRGMPDMTDAEKRGRPDLADRRQPWKKQAAPASRPAIKNQGFSELQDKPDDYERHEDFDKLEGRNSLLEALKSGRSINKIFISKGEKEGSMSQIIALAKENKIVIQEVDRTRLDKMSTTHAHQGVIAFVAAKNYVEVDDILEIAEKSGMPPFIIVLDEITDPHNLGSVLRSADAAGAHGVIIPKRRAIGLTAVVSKASAGAIEYMPVARVTNIPQTIDYLKKKGIWIVGTDSTGEKPFYQNDLTGSLALVIGSEGEGMGKLVRESCDFVVNIPMKGQISSLNAAVAGAIVMFEILKQRNEKK